MKVNNDKNTDVINESILDFANSLRWKVGPNYHDVLMESIYKDTAQIADNAVSVVDENHVSIGIVFWTE